jgi:hypothetical protein
MHVRDLLAQLLPLGLFDLDHSHSATSYRICCHPVERHCQLAVIDYRDVSRDVHVSLDNPRLFDIGVRWPELDSIAAKDVLFADVSHPGRVLPYVDHRVVRKKRVIIDRWASCKRKGEPRRDADAHEVLSVEVAEEVLVGACLHEQVGGHGGADDTD